MTLHDLFSKAMRLGGSIGVVLACVVVPPQSANAQQPDIRILHVGGEYAVDDPSGQNPGEAWGNAFLYPQDALYQADVLLSGQDPPDWVEIWVAAGTYYPDDGDDWTNNDRFATFQLVDLANLRLYGGFAGGESSLHQRDPIVNTTTLSGDLQQNDQPNFVNRDDNAYNVLYSEQTDSTVIIDGFTITGGNAEGSFFVGGGMYITSTVTLLRCIFTENEALEGGAIEISGPNQPVILYNCRFINNRALGSGGAIAQFGSLSQFLNCLFAGNTALGTSSDGQGGALYIVSDKDIAIANCTVVENSAEVEGGGMWISQGENTLVMNSIAWDNVAATGSVSEQQILDVSDTIVVSFSNVEGGWSGSGTGNIGDQLPQDDPDFVDAANGNYRLVSSSPCIDAADGDYLVTNHPDVFNLDQIENDDPSEPTPDLDLNCRIVDDTGTTDTGGSGEYPFADMGAFEFQVNTREECPADLTGDWNVGPADLAELLATWGECPQSGPCPADIAPVGNPDGVVGPADLAELLANWGMCDPIQCDIDFGGESLMGGGGGEEGGAGEQDWPEVEMTEEIYDWIVSSPLANIWEWLWSLLEE